MTEHETNEHGEQEPSGTPEAPSSHPDPEGAETPRVGDTRPAPRIGDTRPVAPSPGGAPPEVTAAPSEPEREPNRQPTPVVNTPLGDLGPTEPKEGGSGRRRRRRGGRDRAKTKAVGRYLMCVHVAGATTHIAMLEGRSLVEHYVVKETDETTQIDGNLYLGRVQNVLPGMEAAFVDIGIPKNAVLYRGDLRYDIEDVEGGGAGQGARIEELLKAGQLLVCQVTKNPIGAKGARQFRHHRHLQAPR